MEETRSDQELVAAANAGDATGFEGLYHRYKDWVVNLSYRFTNDRDIALDVLQETFMYFLKKFPGFELTAQVKTFLYPTVKHLSIGAQQKVRKHNPGDEGLDGLSAEAEPDKQDDTRTELAALMDDLPDTQREVILLRFVDDLSLKEIAEVLSIPVGTVKSRLHLGLKALREDPRTATYFDQ